MNSLQAIKKFVYTGHTGAVYALEQGPEPHLFFSGSGDHLVVMWNMLNREPGSVVVRLPGVVYCLKYIASAHMLIAGQSLGGIHIIDLGSKNETRHLAYHQDGVFDLLTVPARNLLVTAGGDGTIHFISLNGFQVIKSLHFGKLKVRCLKLNPEQDKLLVGCQDGSLSMINLEGFILENRWQIHPEGFSLNSAAYISNDNLLITGSRDACLKVLDAKNNFSELQTIEAHNYAIYHIVNSPTNDFFATASRDKTLKIWDINKMEVLLRIDSTHFEGHVNSVNRLLWTRQQSHLLSAGDDRSIIEWEIQGL